MRLTIRETPNADYVICAKDALSPSAMRPVKWLAEKHGYGEFDDDIDFEITTSQTNEDKAAGRTENFIRLLPLCPATGSARRKSSNCITADGLLSWRSERSNTPSGYPICTAVQGVPIRRK